MCVARLDREKFLNSQGLRSRYVKIETERATNHVKIRITTKHVFSITYSKVLLEKLSEIVDEESNNSEQILLIVIFCNLYHESRLEVERNCQIIDSFLHCIIIRTCTV